MVDRHADREAVAIKCLQGEECLRRSWALHRPHGVGQHQYLVAALQGIAQHGSEIGVHEGFAASEPNFAKTQFLPLCFVQQRRHFCCADVFQRVIGGGRLDIAIGAGQIAERACVDPQGLEGARCYPGAAFARGRQAGILKLSLNGPRHFIHVSEISR